MTAPKTPLRPGGATPAGGGTPRTWRIELPVGMDLLNANRRHHWAHRARVTRAIRGEACDAARNLHPVPRLQRAHITGLYEPPDRRRRDPANLYPSFKAAIDGLVDAGVLPDDDSEHLDGPDMRLGPVHLGGRLVLVITELEAP